MAFLGVMGTKPQLAESSKRHPFVLTAADPGQADWDSMPSWTAEDAGLETEGRHSIAVLESVVAYRNEGLPWTLLSEERGTGQK